MNTVRPFTDRAAIASYADDTPRKVPGYSDLHRMAMLLLAERAPPTAEILVYGAGGGLELRAFADAQPGWSFIGVDPSAEMLELARDVVEPHLARMDLLQGYIGDTPHGPFDGATCLLTMHFLTPDERLEVLNGIRRRLKPGASFVLAHHCAPAGGDLQAWLTRSILFADKAHADLEKSIASAAMMGTRLPIQTTGQEEELLVRAGFSNIALFYAAFSFRGWVATA